jgi:hypothetical protein
MKTLTKTLARTAAIGLIALTAFCLGGCNVEWTSTGSVTLNGYGRPTETCYQPVETCAPPVVVAAPCRERVVVERPVVTVHCAPAPRISRWLRR